VKIIQIVAIDIIRDESRHIRQKTVIFGLFDEGILYSMEIGNVESEDILKE
jgi:hypothetical protein